MHLLPLLKVVGILVLVLGGAQLLPMAVAVLYGEPEWAAFLQSGLAAMAVGALMWGAARNSQEISERDGFAAVTLGWLAAAAVGAAPYYLTGATPALTDAMFESMAGFTTTGSSIVQDYSALGRGMFVWRSLTQWFGGMGIVVLALVILPALGIGGMQLYKREVPGPYSEKLTPRLRDTARALWSVYLLITVVEALVLYALGMTPFEAINHALTTVSTGGFSTRAGSIGEFASPAIEWAIIAFMFVAGMNFALHYRLLFWPGRRGTPYHRDPEWLLYVSAVIVAAGMASVYLLLTQGYDLGQAATKGTFQVVSILTTTGYASDDYAVWGAFPQMLLVILMVAGGCAGSTSGGVKWVRLLLLGRFVHTETVRLMHPRVVVNVKIGHTRVTPEILNNILALLFLYVGSLAVVTLLVALDGNDPLTAIGAAASALGNVGPGLGAVGPTSTYAALAPFSKWVLIVAMLMGRLELMTVIVLLMPQLWRR